MSSKIYNSITGETKIENTKILEHITWQYVDDSNNVITSNDSKNISEYINKYFKLIEWYYNLNKLKLNPDKSKIMISYKPSIRSSVDNIKLKTSDYIIEQVPKIKALGVFITAGLSNHATINHLTSKVNYRLAVLKQVFKFCEKKAKIILMKSLVISIIRYCCPLLINSNVNLISKLQTQLMKCTRYILGYKYSK